MNRTLRENAGALGRNLTLRRQDGQPQQPFLTGELRRAIANGRTSSPARISDGVPAAAMAR